MSTIDVYVRLGSNEKERTLSFRRPPDIRDDDILDRGYAIDGKDIMTAISSSPGESSLAGNLLRVQKEIRDWMKEHDHGVKFV